MITPKSTVKDKPVKRLKKKYTGIYNIVCLANKKIYVGSSTDVDKNLRSHLIYLRKGNHAVERLQEDFNYYGESRFRFKIIERFTKTFLKDKSITQKDTLLRNRTNEWKKRLNSLDFDTGYNTVTTRIRRKFYRK